MKITKRFMTVLNVFRAIRQLSKKRDVAALQVKYGITHEKVVRITFVDEGRYMHLQVKNGVMHVMADKVDYDVELRLTVDTFLNIIAKRLKKLNYKSGKIEFLPYSFYAAYRYGDIVVNGEASTNDVKSFIDIFDDHINDINEIISGKMKLPKGGKIKTNGKGDLSEQASKAIDDAEEDEDEEEEDIEEDDDGIDEEVEVAEAS